jgi:hypothetical protein
MPEMMFIALGLTCILQLVIILLVGAKVRRLERTINEHSRHLYALNQLDRAMARQIDLVRRAIKRIEECTCHSGCPFVRTTPAPRGERTTGDGQPR